MDHGSLPSFSADEIAQAAARIRLHDPNEPDLGAFESMNRIDTLIWLRILGVAIPTELGKTKTEEDLRNVLRTALWDSQRLDNIWPGKALTDKKKLDLSKLLTWPDVNKPRAELNDLNKALGKLDGYKDAERLNSYAFRHFALTAFTQMENYHNLPENPPPGERGAWIATRLLMQRITMELTRTGLNGCPFVVYYSEDESKTANNLLLIELVDVKQCPWPEPTKKHLRLYKTNQETKFGRPQTDPLVPMLQTPVLPLVTVRYTYLQGRPADGSQFLVYLEQKIAKSMPHASVARVRVELENQLKAGDQVDEAYIRMFARLLSFNNTLLDKSYIQKAQAGVPQDVIDETKLSFFVPCLRLRWRTLEELEVGRPIKLLGTSCQSCSKEDAKQICGGCKAVYYCGNECSQADWDKHNDTCKTCKRLLENPDSFPSNKLYVPTRTYVDFIPEKGFANEQEAVKYSGTSNIGDSNPNEYGNERFLVQTQMPANYSHNGKFKGQTILLWDRRRSLLLRASPGDPVMAKERAWGYEIPFHAQGHATYKKVLAQKGIQGQAIYLWAKRVGDALELDLEDIPDQTDVICKWE